MLITVRKDNPNVYKAFTQSPIWESDKLLAPDDLDYKVIHVESDTVPPGFTPEAEAPGVLTLENLFEALKDKDDGNSSRWDKLKGGKVT